MLPFGPTIWRTPGASGALQLQHVTAPMQAQVVAQGVVGHVATQPQHVTAAQAQVVGQVVTGQVVTGQVVTGQVVTVTVCGHDCELACKDHVAPSCFAARPCAPKFVIVVTPTAVTTITTARNDASNLLFIKDTFFNPIYEFDSPSQNRASP